MSLWWIAWTGGILLLLLFTMVVIRGHGDRPVPQLPFSRRPRGRIPWWGWLLLGAGAFLITVATGRLTSTDAGWFALLAAAYGIASIGQSLLIRQHNRSRRSSTAAR